MPRYFFHVHNGKDLPDDEGVELGSADCARKEAVRALGQMLSDDAEEFWDNDKLWTMHVVNEQNETVCDLNFSASDHAANPPAR